MKKLLVVGLCLMAMATAVFAVDYFVLCAKDNPALGEELVIIGKVHPDWKDAVWGNEERMRWVLDNAEKYPMMAIIILDFADNHPKFADWAWDHPVIAKRAAIYEAAHRRAERFVKKHPGMAAWVKTHPRKAKWMAHRHKVVVKKTPRGKVVIKR